MVHGFSLDVNSVQKDIAGLNISKGQSIWLLFASAEGYRKNGPVKDHMNLCRENPLIGPVQGEWPRFPDMSSVYTDTEGVIVVLGEDKDLVKFEEPWVGVCGGVWEALVLSQRGLTCRGWIVGDMEKWVNELEAFV